MKMLTSSSAMGFQIRQSSGDFEAQPRNVTTEDGKPRLKEPREHQEAFKFEMFINFVCAMC